MLTLGGHWVGSGKNSITLILEGSQAQRGKATHLYVTELVSGGRTQGSGTPKFPVNSRHH